MTPRALIPSLVTTTATLIAPTAPAMANDLDASTRGTLTPSVGARIGGYGFRHVTDNQLIGWDNCRMNGVGVFGNLDFASSAYAELSVDLYHATARPITQGLDRLSLHTLGVLGYRMMPDALITPNVHIGGGLEWTKVDVFGDTDTRTAPIGFIGAGGEINVRSFHFGLALRAHLMQIPEYQWGNATTITYETEAAAQMIFTARYAKI